MALTINLRHLEDRDLQLSGELSAEELDIETKDEVIQLRKPLAYELEVQLLDDSLLVQGSLSLPLSCECVRCLKPFEQVLQLEPYSLHIPLQGEEAARVANDLVDLTPYLREDILLDFPQHPLCDAECGGLPKSTVDKAKQAKIPEETTAASSAWGELNKLKL